MHVRANTSSQKPIRRLALLILGSITVVAGSIGAFVLLAPRDTTNPQSNLTTDASKVCSEHARMDAPAYTAGSQPPTALFARANTRPGEEYQAVYVLGSAPLSSPLYDAYRIAGSNLSHTRTTGQTPVLVGCITRSQETATGQVCKYSNGKEIPVYTAAYRLTVYEARSRTVVTDVSIPATGDYTCTSFAEYDGAGLYHTWDPAPVAAALQTLVQ